MSTLNKEDLVLGVTIVNWQRWALPQSLPSRLGPPPQCFSKCVKSDSCGKTEIQRSLLVLWAIKPHLFLRMTEIKDTTQSNHKFLGSWFISKIHFVVRKKNHWELKYQHYAWERKFTIFFFNQLILERITSLQKSRWKETILQFNSRQETSIRKKKTPE